MDAIKNPFRMSLQLFGEGEGTAPEGLPAQAEEAPAAEGEGQRAEPAEKRFTKAEVDAMIQSRLERYKRDENKRIAEARSEAEKLARMNESERAEHERRQAEQDLQTREAEIARRESEIARRELKAQAMETLTAKGLDKSLAELLDYASAETCDASIARMEKAFRAAVQAAVESRLSGSAVTLTRDGQSQAAPTEAEQIAARIGRTSAEANRAANDIISKYI